jgi:hypothetical protein
MRKGGPFALLAISVGKGICPPVRQNPLTGVVVKLSNNYSKTCEKLIDTTFNMLT